MARVFVQTSIGMAMFIPLLASIHAQDMATVLYVARFLSKKYARLLGSVRLRTIDNVEYTAGFVITVGARTRSYLTADSGRALAAPNRLKKPNCFISCMRLFPKNDFPGLPVHALIYRARALVRSCFVLMGL